MELDNVTECNLRWEEFPKDNEIRRERSLTAKVGDMMQINKGMVLIKVVYSLINLGNNNNQEISCSCSERRGERYHFQAGIHSTPI